jgi:hypothetical protein
MTLVRSGFIAIPPGGRPGFDHADVYQDGSGASRVYVAHTGADRVEVIDCAASAYLRALPGHPGVAGVLIDAAADLLFTSDRAAARACIYRCSTEEPLARVGTGPHPNALAFDPGRQQLLTFNLGQPPGHNCTASVISLDPPHLAATIALPGRPARRHRPARQDRPAAARYHGADGPGHREVVDPRPGRLGLDLRRRVAIQRRWFASFRNARRAR